jgi:hypothetical protein
MMYSLIHEHPWDERKIIHVHKNLSGVLPDFDWANYRLFGR